MAVGVSMERASLNGKLGQTCQVFCTPHHQTLKFTHKYHTHKRNPHPSRPLYITGKPVFSSSFSMNYSVDQKSCSRVFSFPEYSGLDSRTAAFDMDQESCGSSAEEVESPRSVVGGAAEVRNRKSAGDKVRAHSQILRIRAEDLHLGGDIGEGKLNLRDKSGFRDFVIYSRPILPASPLGGKTEGH